MGQKGFPAVGSLFSDRLLDSTTIALALQENLQANFPALDIPVHVEIQVLHYFIKLTVSSHCCPAN